METKETSSFNQSSVTNQTEVGSTRCDLVDSSVYPFFMIVYSLVFLVGLLLNGFIIKFYLCQAQPQASSSIMVYLKNLAAADFLLCLCLPLRIMKYASRSVTIHLAYCNFGSIIFYLNMYASILFMGYIAANRYLKIVHPLGTHILQTVRGARIISTVTWVCFLTLISSYVILLVQTQEPLTSTPDVVICGVLYSGRQKLVYKIMQICCGTVFIFVLISLVFFYCSTSRRVLAQQRQSTSSGSKKLAKSHRKMIVLVTVFCFCFVPYHFVRIPSTFLWRNCSWRKVLYYLMETTIIMSVLNICLDPLIYFLFCKAFRNQLNLRVLSRNS
ncbi:P2Y purinoceptor 14-like [Embiotoca jacksoni]|uniref:P2Y purinoceptor 14-like n=1 Tax=Embiotoca jacksoni TaxID=100190 RepID=UPI003703E0C6